MTKISSVIEINGNRYDAVTGQMIGKVKTVAYQVKSTPSGVIDGFTRNLAAHSPKITASRIPKAKKASDKEPNFAQTVHKRAQRSQTLMRSAVLKGKEEAGAKIASSSAARLHKFGFINPVRQSRAQAVVKNDRVSKFKFEGASPGQKQPLTKAAQKQLKGFGASAPAAEVIQPPRPAKTAPKTMINSLSSQQLERLLDHALLKADAHKHALKAGRRKGRLSWFNRFPSWANAGAALAVVLLLGGFFAWQNIPQLSMKIAASRADISAAVPDYMPSGFSFSGPIGYSGGAVSIKFKANSDSQRTFSLTEQKSNWDSQTLVANSIPADSALQTSQVKGTTVYIYGPENHATWVDRGVRYTLHNQASLNSDQILKLAGSL